MKKAPTPTTLKPRKSYGITRVDQLDKASHGFYVRMRIGGKQTAKFFSDGVYGKRRLAQEAAENFRDSLFDKLSPRWQRAASLPRKKGVTK